MKLSTIIILSIYAVISSSCANAPADVRVAPENLVAPDVVEVQDPALTRIEVDTGADHYAVFQGAELGWRQSDTAKRYGESENYIKDITGTGIASSAERLGRFLRESNHFESDNGPELRRRVLLHLADLIKRSSAATANSLDLVDGRFQLQAKKGVVGDQPATSTRLFDGEASAFSLRETPMKESIPVAVADIENAAHYASIEQAIEIRTIAWTVEHIFAEVREDPFKAVVKELNTIDQSWTNYLEHGYSQYPWESYFNSTVTPMIFGDFAWYDPPSDQIVLMHPELSLLLDTRSSRGSTEVSLLVHGLGYIHYAEHERDWFVGVSATASFASNEGGMGFGPTIHFGHTRLSSSVPHISLSVLWQDYETGSDGPVVGVSMDIWRLFSSGSKDLFLSPPK